MEITTQNHQIEVQQHTIPPATTVIQKTEQPTIQVRATVAGQVFRQLFQITFYVQFFLIFILVVYLTIHGFVSSAKNHHFHPKKWYPPVLASTACAGIVSFSLQWICCQNPEGTMKAMFWISPLLTCAVGVLFVLIGSAVSLAVGITAVISAVILSLYACWVNPRFQYATKILQVSIAFAPAKTTTFVILSIITSVVYSTTLVTGIGGASTSVTVLDILFILLIMLSLAWSMQVFKNVLYVTVARIRYINFACGAEMDTQIAIRDTIKHLIGSICIGSALVPVIGTIRGSARTISLVAGDVDEFMFSCADCYSGVASTLIAYGNRWGFVHVGVYNKGFVQASVDVWEMFKRLGLIPLIDSDLTGAFCFLCGIAVGSICSLTGGAWALAIHKSYATEVCIFTFFIGYFMGRIAMAWQQACVAAYYVAYAENPQSLRYDSTIPDRMQELQRYQA